MKKKTSCRKKKCCKKFKKKGKSNCKKCPLLCCSAIKVGG